ncbi:MAG: S41 family peptidase [Bacteroidota bacterium]
MKTIRQSILVCLPLTTILFAQPASPPRDVINWTSNIEQKVWGLMTVWAETKYAFPHRERLSAIRWDSLARSFIPKVIAAQSEETYYNTLMELTAFLGDSHTEIIPPWGRLKQGYDIPPVELAILDGKFYIIRTGTSQEIARQHVHPGMEVLEVEKNIPVSQSFKNNVLRYHTRGTKHGSEAILIMYLLYGPGGSVAQIKVKETDGAIRNIELTRNAMSGGEKPFMYGFLPHIFARKISSQVIPNNILYVLIPNFDSPNKQILEGFIHLIDTTDLAGIRGMIIDLRYNTGGSHTIMHPIVQCLIDSAVSIPTNHFVQYCPAPSRWGPDPAFTMRSRDYSITPRMGKRYNGPLALLVGPITHSSGEDMVIELKQRNNCVTVGTPTSGGAGGKFPFSLPGGGEFSVSTFKATFPDGTEYMNTGILPDVIVQPTLGDILAHRDVILNKAIELINTWPGD